MTKIQLPKIPENPRTIYVLSDNAAKDFFNRDFKNIIDKYTPLIEDKIISEANGKSGQVVPNYRVLDFNKYKNSLNHGTLDIYLEYKQEINKKSDVLISAEKYLEFLCSIDEKIPWHKAEKTIRAERGSNVLIYNIKNPRATSRDLREGHINTETKEKILPKINSALEKIEDEIKKSLEKRSAILTRRYFNGIYTL